MSGCNLSKYTRLCSWESPALVSFLLLARLFTFDLWIQSLILPAIHLFSIFLSEREGKRWLASLVSAIRILLPSLSNDVILSQSGNGEGLLPSDPLFIESYYLSYETRLQRGRLRATPIKVFHCAYPCFHMMFKGIHTSHSIQNTPPLRRAASYTNQSVPLRLPVFSNAAKLGQDASPQGRNPFVNYDLWLQSLQ